MVSCLQENADGVILSLQFQPRSSRNQIVGLRGDFLKIKLCSPPVDGAANKRCCEYLAKLFAVPKSRVELITGDRARQKRILLRGVALSFVENIIKSNL